MRIDASKFIYLPILKAKLGEYCGARETSEELKPFVAPIVVVPPASDLDHEKGRPLVPAEHVRLFGPRIFSSWGKRPIFVDALNLDDAWHKEGLVDHPLTALIQRARSVGSMPMPVTSLRRSPEYQLAVKRAFEFDRYGVCLRLGLEDMESETLAKALDRFLKEANCSPSETALIVDFSARDFGDPSTFAELLIDRLNHLPYLNDWRLVAFSGTEFPQKISVAPEKSKSFRRGEWIVAEKLLARKSELIRLPLFSDYGIEHPVFATGDGRGANVHLRYSTSADYMIHKGKKFGEVGYAGIIAVAKALIGSDYFHGEGYSAGDKMIFDWANGHIPPGTASMWRQAGVCHHLALVVRQLSKHLGITIPTRAPATESVQQELFATTR
jgi:Beta protein